MRKEEEEGELEWKEGRKKGRGGHEEKGQGEKVEGKEEEGMERRGRTIIWATEASAVAATASIQTKLCLLTYKW